MHLIYENSMFAEHDAENLRRRLIQFFKSTKCGSGITLIQIQDMFSYMFDAIKIGKHLSLKLVLVEGRKYKSHQISADIVENSQRSAKKAYQIQLSRSLSTSEMLDLQASLTRPSREQLVQKIQVDKAALEVKNQQISELNHVLEGAMYNALVSVAALRDNETGDHLLRTSTLGRQLAEAFWHENPHILPCCEGKTIELAIPLHDIGKVGIPDSILLKPGKLTETEFEIMKGHSDLGADLIARFRADNNLEHDKVLEIAQGIAKSHHENFDGSGYPDGINGYNIPFAARVMAIVDVYDALLSKRPYKKAMSKAEAIGEMIKVSKQKFDPDLFAVFLEIQSASK